MQPCNYSCLRRNFYVGRFRATKNLLNSGRDSVLAVLEKEIVGIMRLTTFELFRQKGINKNRENSADT